MTIEVIAARLKCFKRTVSGFHHFSKSHSSLTARSHGITKHPTISWTSYPNLLKLAATLSAGEYGGLGSPALLPSEPKASLLKNGKDKKVYKSTKEHEYHGLETNIRDAIVKDDRSQLKMLLETRLSQSTKLPSGRDIVFVIAETCRRSDNLSNMLPIMLMIPLTRFDSEEGDIIPMINFCAENNCMKNAFELLVWLEDERHVQFSAKSYSILLKGFGRQGNQDMLELVMDRLYQNNIVIDIILINSLIDAFIRCGNVGKAIAVFDTMNGSSGTLRHLMGNDISSSEYATVASYFSKILPRANTKNKNGRMDEGIIDDNTIAINPNVRTFNTILKAFREGRDSRNATVSIYRCSMLLDLMQRQGVAPDSITLNTLVDVYVLSGEVRKGEMILRASNISFACNARPGVEAFTSVISGYASKGDSEGAFRILDLMLKNGVRPNCKTLTSLMNACIVSGKLSKANELLSGLHSKFNLSLSSQDISAVYGAYVIGLCGMAVNTRIQDSSEYPCVGGVYDLSQDLSSSPPHLSSSPKDSESLLHLHQAQAMLLLMESRNITPDTATMNSFLYALCSAVEPSRVNDAILVYEAMVEQGIMPDKYTFATLLNGLGRDGHAEKAYELYHACKDKDVVVVNAFLKALANSDKPQQAMPEFFRIVNLNNVEAEDGSQPTTTTTSLLQSKKTNANGSNGNAVIPIFTDTSFSPDKMTYTILFVALSRTLSPRQMTPYTPFFDSDSSPDAASSYTSSSSSPSPSTSLPSLPLPLLLKKVSSTENSDVNDVMVRDDDNGSSQKTTISSNRATMKSASTSKKSLKGTKSLPSSPDEILRRVFSYMMYESKIEPDEVMVRVLNSLFSIEKSSVSVSVLSRHVHYITFQF